MNTRNRGIDWGSLILGALFLIGAFYAFMNPAATIQTVSTFFSIMIILYGIVEIISFFRLRQLENSGPLIWFDLIAGIFGVIVGIYLFLNPAMATSIMTVLFAVWFLFIFIRGLFVLPLVRQISTVLFWVSLAINILGVILGLLLIVNPLSALLTLSQMIALGLLFGGFTLLINAFV